MRSRASLAFLLVASFRLLLLPTAARGELLTFGFGDLISINEATGEGTTIGSTLGYGPYAAAVAPSGTIYITADNWLTERSFLGRIDPLTAAISPGPTLSGPINHASEVSALEFSPDGTLFAIERYGLNDRLHTIDVATAVSTLVGSTGLPGVTALAFSPDGTLYGWETGDLSGAGALGLVTIDALTGVTTDVNPAVGEPYDVSALAFAADGTLYGAFSDLFTVDVATGELTLVGPIEVPAHPFFNANLMVWIPEPSALTILLTTAPIALLAYLRCRKRKGAA